MNFNQLDLNLLKALHALLQERNVSRAAERLSLTQPAVSNMLSRLRDMFNDPLFIRSSHGMLPTDRALSLDAPITAILQQIEQAVNPLSGNPADWEITFKLAATENGIRALGLPFALKVAELAPKVNIAFLPVQGMNIEEKLAKGEWDLAIAGEQVLSDGLYHQRLLDERYICAVRPEHPVLAQDWNIETFCALDFAMVSYNGGGFSGATDDALQALGLHRRVKFSLTHFSQLADLLRRSDIAAVAPYHYLMQEQDLVLLEPPFNIEGYHKAMVWHARTRQDPVQQWFRGVMTEVADSAAGLPTAERR